MTRMTRSPNGVTNLTGEVNEGVSVPRSLHRILGDSVPRPTRQRALGVHTGLRFSGIVGILPDLLRKCFSRGIRKAVCPSRERPGNVTIYAEEERSWKYLNE